MNALINLKGIRKNYRLANREIEVLKGIDLDVQKGRFVCIMGPSGSGKSTLLNIIGCLDRPSAGVYELEGRKIGAVSDDDLSGIRNRKMGFVFQNFNLLPRLPAWKNVELPLIYSGIGSRDRKKRAHEMLERVGLADRAEHSPSEMSGGEQQRVAIARALVNVPLIILADEPTGNLDSASGREIMGIFRDLHRDGTTVLLVTHEREISAYGERVITIRDGICRDGCF
ncbi:macrolide export ATP-binding/permease protein MacB [bacterium BMS3Bbin06]|nr:macrolide export ATP-binding/permease protein MacB [bacterium BMS3Abin08]GBE34096.1 macrolide export ATP-binding/permease protein MacB [bacterium BMS3Bbin06]HDO36123.1 ABC transporter ATP-binding protein [Nitrospirota bacterium]HDY70511.1 ABC transporter ATP-binding protein [Nitrospirota bacterium]